MKRLLARAAAFFLLIGPAQAGLSKAALDSASAPSKTGASIPLALTFRDENGLALSIGDALAGRPALLVFADYTCRTLCGPIVEFAAAGLAQTGLKAGSDFRLLIIGIDPRDSLEDARALKARHVDPLAPLWGATRVLSGDAASVRSVTAAADYRYVYDEAHDQFAHPAAALVLDARGRVTRVLSALAMNGSDLRLALVGAAGGSTGTLADQVRLLCYGFDPDKGIYTAVITTSLAAASACTVVLLAAGIAFLAWRGRRERVA
jgi:protein SCO1/2